MPKNSYKLPPNQRTDLTGLACILAFLIGVLFFLIFGEQHLGVKPEPVWISLLMGLSISAIVFWVWGVTHQGNDDE